MTSFSVRWLPVGSDLISTANTFTAPVVYKPRTRFTEGFAPLNPSKARRLEGWLPKSQRNASDLWRERNNFATRCVWSLFFVGLPLLVSDSVFIELSLTIDSQHTRTIWWFKKTPVRLSEHLSESSAV